MSQLPKPDTHCIDTDTGLDVWSYSKEQMLQFRRDALDEAALVCDALAQKASSSIAKSAFKVSANEIGKLK